MSYLVGDFTRHNNEYSTVEYPMWGTKIVQEITKDHLIKAKNDDHFQVINLKTLQFYDPVENKWTDIERP